MTSHTSFTIEAFKAVVNTINNLYQKKKKNYQLDFKKAQNSYRVWTLHFSNKLPCQAYGYAAIL